MGHKPWSGCRCSPKTGPGSALASLAPGTHPRGSWDKAAAGVLGCWKSLTVISSSAEGWYGQVKSGKSLPKGKVINRSYRRAQSVTATWSSSWELKGTPFNTARGTIYCGRTQMLGARLYTVNTKLILSPQAFLSILRVCFCQLHLIPIQLSKVSMGWQREALCNLVSVRPRHNIHISTAQFPHVNWMMMRSVATAVLHHTCGE